MTEPKSKSVTLYLSEEVIDRLGDFSTATHRSKSLSAEVLILHGLANYDVRSAAPKKVVKPKAATKANTRVKKPALPKAPRYPKAVKKSETPKPAAKRRTATRKAA